MTNCGCTPAAREVAGGRVGRVNVHESWQRGGGTRERDYQGGPELPFVLRGRWFVIEVFAIAEAASLQTWIRCGGEVLPGEVAHRSSIAGSGAGHEHQFLALFPGSADDLSTPICDMYVVLGPTQGLGLTRMKQRVYLVNRATERPLPIGGMTWGVAIEGEPALPPAEVRARLEPVPPPPEPLLCRVP